MLKTITMTVVLLFGTALRAADISEGPWRLWLDKNASWEDDKLFLPEEATDVSKLPYNPPTGGWDVLANEAGIPVKLPATVEEYYWEQMLRDALRDDVKKYNEGINVSPYRKIGAYRGVSWWWREIEVPPLKAGQRLFLNFRAARFRAEVFLNGKLVGYNVVAEVPFSVDATSAARPGLNKLTLRITNPGGNFNWTDWDSTWGKYTLPASHGFGGLDAGIEMLIRDDSFVEDLAVLNKTTLGDVRVTADVRTGANPLNGVLNVTISDMNGKKVWEGEKQVTVKAGAVSTVDIDITVPDVKAWNLDTPTLYRAEAKLRGLENSEKQIRFGFRTFRVADVGGNAHLEVNGRRVVLKSMISWGYWGINGLFPDKELAYKEVNSAKQLGLNCLNFHRNLGDTLTLNQMDEQGLFCYEEPGAGSLAFQSQNPQLKFAAHYMAEKIFRMVRRDRNHPSVLIFNMANECGLQLANDFDKQVFHTIHRLAPDRAITLTSGINLNPPYVNPGHNKYERMQSAMRPWDDTIYTASNEKGREQCAGWYCEHSVNGAGVYLDTIYENPNKFWHKGRTKTEIMSWGEMMGFGSPDQHGRTIQWFNDHNRTGYMLWDAKRIYAGYKQFLAKYGFEKYFPDPDDLFRSAGNKSYSSWKTIMEMARISDENDLLIGNGWDSTNYDDHSGLVDGLRNFKGDPKVMRKGLDPLMLSIMARKFIVPINGEAQIDFWIVNEKDLKGEFTLKVTAHTPSGKVAGTFEKDVSIEGGICFGQLLAEDVHFKMPEAGMTTVEAELVQQGKSVLKREEKLHVVDWKGSPISSKVYVWEDDGEVKNAVRQLGAPLVDKPEDADVIVFSTKSRPESSAPAKPIEGNLFKEDANVNLGGIIFKLDGFANGPCELQFYLPKQPDMRPSYNIDVNGRRVVSDVPYKVDPEAKTLELFTHTATVAVTDGRLVVKGAEINRDERMVRECTGHPPYVDPQIFMCGLKITDAAGKVTRLCTGRDDITDAEGNVWKAGMYRPSDALASLVRLASEKGKRLVVVPDSDRAFEPLLGSLPGIQNLRSTARVDAPWMGGWFFTRPHKLIEGLPTGEVMDWKTQAGLTYGRDFFYADQGGANAISYAFDAPELDVAVGLGADHQGDPGIVAATWKAGNMNVAFFDFPQFVRALGDEGWAMNHWIALKMFGNAIR